MPTDVMTLSEYAENLANMAENWEDDEPVVLIGDVHGSVNVSAKNGYTKRGSVAFAQEVFEGNGVYELGEKVDSRWFGTVLLDRGELCDEARQTLEEHDYPPAADGGEA